MKNKGIIICNAILFFAVLLLYILHFKTKANCQNSQPTINSVLSNASSKNMAIAYINSDSILEKYTYYQALKSGLESKQARLEADYSNKMKRLQEDYYDYQTKAQKGLLTRNEMQDKEVSLQQRQQELSLLNQKLSDELLKDEQDIQKQIYDSVKKVTDMINKDGKFEVILNSASKMNVITADPKLDLTSAILELLNERYKSSKK